MRVMAGGGGLPREQQHHADDAERAVPHAAPHRRRWTRATDRRGACGEGGHRTDRVGVVAPQRRRGKPRPRPGAARQALCGGDGGGGGGGGGDAEAGAEPGGVAAGVSAGVSARVYAGASGGAAGALGVGRVTTVPLSGRYSGPVWPQPPKPSTASITSVAAATGAAPAGRLAEVMRGSAQLRRRPACCGPREARANRARRGR
jgi:hypothetical protein